MSAITGPGISASYKIAATGMRVEKTTNNQTTRFVYGLGGQLLYERNTSTGQTSQHLYLNGQPVGLVRNNTLHYVLPDHLGRPEVIVNQANQQVWRATLTAFERNVIRDQIGGYALGFPGQYHDPETGFAYNVHRDYDPATGRYLQSDPIGLAGGLNTYTYARNNPIRFIDPLGLECGCPGTGEMKVIRQTVSPPHSPVRAAELESQRQMTHSINSAGAGFGVAVLSGGLGRIASALVGYGAGVSLILTAPNDPIVAGESSRATFYEQGGRVHMQVERIGADGSIIGSNFYGACGPND